MTVLNIVTNTRSAAAAAAAAAVAAAAAHGAPVTATPAVTNYIHSCRIHDAC